MVPRKTIVLLAAALAMLLAALRFGTGGRGDGASRDSAPVPGFSPDAAVSVRMGLGDGSTVELSRQTGGGWAFSAPDSGRADAQRVALFLDAAFGGRVRDRVTARQREARSLGETDFGFAETPPSWIEAVDSSGARASLRFGAFTPSGEGVFAMREAGGDVLVLDRAARDLLPGSRDDIRDRVLFRFSDSVPSAVEIRRPDSPVLRLEPSGGASGWSMVAPYRCPADPAAVSALLDALGTAVAGRFLWTQPPGAAPSDAETARASAGLGPSEIEVSVSVRFEGAGDPLSLAFSSSPDSAAAVGQGEIRRAVGASISDGTVFEVDEILLDALKMPIDVFRDRSLFGADEARCRSLSFTGPSGAVTLERSDSESPWTLLAPSAQPADQGAAAALVSGLLSLRDCGAEPAPQSFVPPAGAVRLSCSFAMADSPAELWFWNDGGDSASAVARAFVPARGMILELPAGSVPAAAFDPRELRHVRARTIAAMAPDSVLSLSLIVPGRPPVAVRRLPGGTWAPGADAPPGAAASAAAADAAVAALAALEAREVLSLAVRDSSAYGLLPPRAELLVAASGAPGAPFGAAAPVSVFQFGASESPGGMVPVRVKGSDAVFALDGATAAALCGSFLEFPQTGDKKR